MKTTLTSGLIVDLIFSSSCLADLQSVRTSSPWPPAWMTELKDWAQLLVWLVAVVGGYFATKKTLAEIKASTEQRKEDLAWRRANSAKELIDDIHHHPLASSAVQMMDWDQGATDQKVTPEKTVKITYSEVLDVLKKQQSECRNEIEIHVQGCFDWFFYYVNRIQHYIDRRVISFDDVRSVFIPYARKIGRHRDIYNKFIISRQYELAPKFWGQYQEYRENDASYQPEKSSGDNQPATSQAAVGK